MYTKSIASVFGVCALLFVLSGCKPDLVIDFNGRMLEFKKFSQLKLPRGIEVTDFDGDLMKLNGRETIKVNGQDVYVSDDEVQVGKNKLTVSKAHKVFIDGSLYELRPKTGKGSSGGGIAEWFR